MRAIILLSHGHRNRQREINQPQNWTRAGTTTAKGTHKDSPPPNQGSVGTREDSVQHRGKGSRLIVTSRKHIARNTIRPATPPRHTPDHAHTCNPGEETKHIRPLTHNPAQNPLNHTQTTNHDQRRWGMLNFLSPNTQAEPSTLQHAKQPGTLY